MAGQKQVESITKSYWRRFSFRISSQVCFGMNLSRIIENKYQIRNYGKTRVDYNNKELDIDEDDNEPKEDWKVKAEESDSEIYKGEISDGEDECRIRAGRN